MRAAVAHRYAEALRRPDGDVGTDRPGRLDQTQGEEVAHHHGQRAHFMEGGDRGAVVGDLPARARVGEQRTEDRGRVEVGGGIADDHLEAERFGAGLQHGDRLGVSIGVDEEDVGRRARGTPGHRHRLGGSGALVEHRGVRDLQSREVTNQGLEIDEGFESSLADLWLIRGVGRVPGGAFQDVALDDGRGDRGVVPHADHRGHHAVHVGVAAQSGDGVDLGERRGEAQGGGRANRIRHDSIDECVGTVVADLLRECLKPVVVDSEVTFAESTGACLVGQDLVGRAAVIGGGWGTGHRGLPVDSPLSSNLRVSRAHGVHFHLG